MKAYGRTDIIALSTLQALALAFGLAACGGKSGQVETPSSQPVFGGSYDNLLPDQRRLIEKWFEEYEEIMGADLKASRGYSQLPLSTRTTFEGVTHALINTELTDDSGKSLGRAIDLVETVETVHGEIPRTKGDMQFRIYTFLKPGTVDLLERSREFNRHKDNTFYHVEYPINYRLEGTPSAQFSIAGDEVRADIDVDYRSSAFPVLLFNGHLSSSNSDVRAGGNYNKHTKKWQGFLNWWRNLFGLPAEQASFDTSAAAIQREFIIPPVPRVTAKEDLATAIEDFFSAWLVEGKPEIAMSYVGEKAYACVLEWEPDSTTTEMAPYRLLRDMKEASRAVGPVQELGDAIEATRPEGLSMKPVPNPHQEQFALFSLPNELVNNYECPHLHATPRPPRPPHGEHFGASLRLKPMRDREALDVFQVWTKEEGHWTMVAFHIDAHTDTRAVPGVKMSGAGQTPERTERIAADSSFVAAVETVLTKWLIDKDYAAASEFFSQRAYDCLNLFHEEAFRVEDEDAQKLLRRRLGEVGNFVGEPTSLESAIRSAVPWAPDIKIVSHDREEAYALLSYSDYHAEHLDCGHRKAGRYHHGERPRDPGRHFATAFHLRRAGDHPPIVTLLWAREDEAWKIVSVDFELH